ncbi:MAG: hypothetical protein NTW29_05590 [Bacteroidetes bacterium]|nr:hypothetical protein [Bacteroidota bacterium]
MLPVPLYINLLFILTTLATVLLFLMATSSSRVIILAVIAVWAGLQAVLAWQGFYTITNATPPRFMLLAAPPLFLIIRLFVSRSGRRFLDQLDRPALTLLHVVRIPVEIVLLLLSIHKMIPVLMTFEGRNLDILAGITAPLIWWLMRRTKPVSTNRLLLWNIVSLGLLLNIVIHAILSAPSPIQQLAFDQPNIAILYFPYVWLPSVIVPLVLLSHLATIRQLILHKKS